MSGIFVAGLINIETTLQVEAFPVTYEPVRFPFFGVNTTVSGVGYNVALALTRLGDVVQFASLTGHDAAGRLVRQALADDRIGGDLVLETLNATAQSVIAYDASGQRSIFVDLKDIQQQTYPLARVQPAISGCSLAVLCNINFTRPFLKLAQDAGKWIATDVHTLQDVADDYNRDYMAAAHILFMSDEKLPQAPEAWAHTVMNHYPVEILVIGMGSQGALLAVRRDGFVGRFPAVTTREVVNTIGAGDALFSSFIHYFVKNQDAYGALQRALVYASHKIGTAGAAQGLLTESELEGTYGHLF
jgi:sugar/nucleoside kinase (ribokinase family)